MSTGERAVGGPIKAGQRGSKRVRDSWTTGIMELQLWSEQGMTSYQDSMWVQLVINKLPRDKFKVGDQVRVRVELLARTRKG